MSPFFINYRRHPFVRNNLWHQPTNKSAGQFTKCIKEIIKQVTEHLNVAAKQMKWFYNLQQNDACDYKKGDKVWLEATNIKTD